MFSFMVFAFYLISVIFIFLSIDRNFSYFTKQIRKGSRLNVRLKEKYYNHELSLLMKNAGVPFNLYHYQIFRWCVLILMFLSTLFRFAFTKELNTSMFFWCIVVFFITIPNETLFGLTSPFQYLINLSQQNKREIYNEELYLVVSQMKNSFLVHKDKPPSSQQIFEEICNYSHKTRPIFNKFISFWMIGEREQAIQYFDKEIGTKEAKKLSQVFSKLDDLNPMEMREQLETYQSIYRAERETKKKKKNEIKSNILFLAVLATALMLMINFLIVGFFIDFLADMSEVL